MIRFNDLMDSVKDLGWNLLFWSLLLIPLGIVYAIGQLVYVGYQTDKLYMTMPIVGVILIAIGVMVLKLKLNHSKETKCW